jgi:hypothetical protein
MPTFKVGRDKKWAEKWPSVISYILVIFHMRNLQTNEFYFIPKLINFRAHVAYIAPGCDDYSNYDFTLRTKLVKNTDGIKWVSLRSVNMMDKVYPIYSKNINMNILTNIKNILDMMCNTCVVMKVTYTYRHC